jgi:hypothetical protein
MKSILTGILALTITATGAAWCQQATAPAQPTPASPRATTADPDLAVTMKAMEEKLRSVGRVTWTQNLQHWTLIDNGYKSVVERKTLSEETVNVAADFKSCLLKVAQKTNWYQLKSNAGISEDPIDESYYLDEIFSVDVLSSEEYLHQYRHDEYSSPYEENVQPSLYSVVFTAWGYTGDLKFSSRESAEEFASLLRESVKGCSAAPVRSANGGDPSQAETLNFIAEKLSAQGRVDANWTEEIFSSKGQPIAGSVPSSGTRFSVDYFQVKPSPTTCSISFDANHARLSFRHVAKIEVLSLNAFRSGLSFPYSGLAVWDEPPRTLMGQGLMTPIKVRVTDASPTFVLKITSPGVVSKQLYFSDETLANRVAKAMNHVAELCLAGSSKEPF